MNTKKFMGVLALLPSLVANAQMVPEIQQVAYDEMPMASVPFVLTAKEKAALRLMGEWRKNPDKPIRTEDGGIMYMHGRPATLVCAALRVCAVRLRPGERLTNIYVGDPRLKAFPAQMGDVTNIVVKPLEPGLTSNMIITTNLGGYNIDVKSTERESMTYISFHYPEDTEQLVAKYKQEQAAAVEAKTMSTGVNADSLDFNYRLSGDNPDWKPVRVYSDDEKRKTYIQFPASRFPDELPVLVIMSEKKGLFSDQQYEMVNYGPVGEDRFVVDKSKLSRAALISGVGDNQVKVMIEHIGGAK